MKLSLILLIMAFSNSFELASVRSRYVDAATSETAAVAFHKSFEPVGSNHSTTLQAYKAASVVLLAKYESGIVKKMKLFNRGTDLLEQTIAKDPSNYEARLIRFNIQDNVPWITGYTSDIKEDKKFLIANYARQPEDLKQFAKSYAMYCESFTSAEKALFK